MPWYENRKGESLWYEERGSGCPVVFLHGWCMSSAVWKCQFDDLAGSFRLLAPDLRGHGCSNKISGALVFDSFANDLADFMESLNLSKVVLVGWSMGAQIALHSSAALSERLAGIILVSATPRFAASDDFPYGLAAKEVDGMRLKMQRNAQRALDGFYARLFAEGELENHPLSSEIGELLSSITAPDTGGVLEALDSLAQADMRQFLPFITVPTLILNGSCDRICLPQASQYLKEHISDAEQVVFPGCGHAPFLTQRHMFNAELVRFMWSVYE